MFFVGHAAIPYSSLCGRMVWQRTLLNTYMITYNTSALAIDSLSN